MKNNVIVVQDISVNIVTGNIEDYICIMDIAKAKIGNSKADEVIRNWLRSRSTLAFLGTWEY